MDTSDGEGEGGYFEDRLRPIPGEWDQSIGSPSRSQNVPEADGVPITKEIIRFGLSRIARTLDTFEFAYSRLDCRKQNINNLDALSAYIHLRLIDLGENKIRSCLPIASIQNMLLLNVEDNLIESLNEIPDLPFLQALCLRKNKLTSSEGMFSNCLAYLQLGDNKIEDVYGFTSDTYPFLTVLELKGNKLTSIVGLDLPQLQRLYLGKNELKDLKGIDGCPSLTHLHARDNKISHLDNFPGLEKLEYVNLRGNDIRRYTQMMLLGNAPNIKTIVLKDNPIASLPDYRNEVLAANLNVRRLDKTPVLETEMVEAKQLRNGRDEGFIPGIADDPDLIAGSASVMELTEMQGYNEAEEEWQGNAG